MTVGICCHNHMRLCLCCTHRAYQYFENGHVAKYLRKVSCLLFSTKALNSTESLHEHGRSGPLPASCKCRTKRPSLILRNSFLAVYRGSEVIPRRRRGNFRQQAASVSQMSLSWNCALLCDEETSRKRASFLNKRVFLELPRAQSCCSMEACNLSLSCSKTADLSVLCISSNAMLAFTIVHGTALIAAGGRTLQ